MLYEAGLSSDNIRLFHISTDGVVTEQGEVRLNNDGTVTISIDRASRYVLTGAVLTAPTGVEFAGTNPVRLSALLAEQDVILQTSGNLGIFEHHSPFVIPAGRTFYVESTLNVQRNAELIIEGTVVVLNGGRINNQGGSASGGGTITIARGGALINNGYVENVSNSTIVNNGTIINNDRFEIRARTTFSNTGIIGGAVDLRVHRDANIVR